MAGRQGRRGREYWQRILVEQEASGQSISAFCEERAVAEGSFFYWRRKLADGQQGSKPAVQEKTGRRKKPDSKSRAKFVPVELPRRRDATQATCEVVLPDGCRILVSTQCDAQWLGDVVEVLRGQTC